MKSGITTLLLTLLLGTVFYAQNSRFVYPKKKIREQVQRFVARSFSEPNESYRIEWLHSIPEIRLLQKPDSINIVYRGNRIPKGNTVLKISFYRYEKILRSFYLSLKINVFQDVWVTGRTVPKGTFLKKDRLKIEHKDITYLSGAPLSNDILNTDWIAKRTLSVGQIVTTDDLRLPYLVHKGHKIDVQYNQDFVKVQLQALALQNGGEGDIIWVKNPETHKRLQVKVVGPNLAEVI